jgi:hypothetical protein
MLEESKRIIDNNEFIDLTTERHIKAKPPREAFLYIPKQWEKIDLNEDEPKKSMRRVFDLPEEEYTNFELENLNQFKHELDRYNNTVIKQEDILILPVDWKPCETLRFLQATHFKILDSIKLIIKYMNWKRTYLPIKITNKAVELLDSGFIYGHGRDYRYRPIFVVRSEIYMKLAKLYSYDDWLLAVIYFCEYIVDKMTIPGQLENWIIIADVSNTSLLQIPSDVSKLFSMLQSNYRCRLLLVYIFGMNQVLNFIWNIIKNMLQPSTHKKIKFLKQDNVKEMFQSINPDQIENRYGGNAPNLEANFFPPYMPNENYLLPGEYREDVLISEDSYKELYISGRITTLSPYIQINDTKSIYTNPYTNLSGVRRLTSNRYCNL